MRVVPGLVLAVALSGCFPRQQEEPEPGACKSGTSCCCTTPGASSCIPRPQSGCTAKFPVPIAQP